MTGRIFAKLTIAVLLVLALALAVADRLASRVAEENFIETLTEELGRNGRMLSALSGGAGPKLDGASLRNLGAAFGGRLTIVARDGSVLGDSEADPRQMDNHLDRPEVAAALSGKRGSSIRLSPTVRVKFLYVAVPYPEGALRLAVPLAQVEQRVNDVRWEMQRAVALAFLPAMIVAALFARLLSSRLGSIIEFAGRLSEGDFNARCRVSGASELVFLSERLNESGDKLRLMFEELQREHAELERLELVRKDFVSNVSHELRTPLASIHGYAETLLDGALQDPQHNERFVRVIRQNAQRLTRLTSDLLTLSHVESGTQAFHFESCSVNRLLEEAVESFRPVADKQGIRMAAEKAPESRKAYCDAEAVHQVLSNLLENALKYTPAGGSVRIASADTTGAGGEASVEISVSDTGCGIPSEELPRLFERFYRVDKARSRELGGTGLGLSIVKHLVRAMGGDVHVQSQPGAGSRFAFTLPKEAPAQADGEAAS